MSSLKQLAYRFFARYLDYIEKNYNNQMAFKLVKHLGPH